MGLWTSEQLSLTKGFLTGPLSSSGLLGYQLLSAEHGDFVCLFFFFLRPWQAFASSFHFSGSYTENVLNNFLALFQYDTLTTAFISYAKEKNKSQKNDLSISFLLLKPFWKRKGNFRLKKKKIYCCCTLTLMGHPKSSTRIHRWLCHVTGWIRIKCARIGGKMSRTTMECRSKFPRNTLNKMNLINEWYYNNFCFFTK